MCFFYIIIFIWCAEVVVVVMVVILTGDVIVLDGYSDFIVFFFVLRISFNFLLCNVLDADRFYLLHYFVLVTLKCVCVLYVCLYVSMYVSM